MNNLTFIILLLIVISPLTTLTVFADEALDSESAKTKNDDKEAITEDAKDTQKALNSLIVIAKGAGLNTDAATRYLKILNAMIRQKTIDSDAVYNAARTINRLLDSLVAKKKLSKMDVASISALSKFVAEVKLHTHSLLRISYSDRVHSSANLSRQVSQRLPNLILDIGELIKQENADNRAFREDFLVELELFSERYLTSNRFTGGIGFTYNYVPTIITSLNQNIDLSDYQANPSGGSSVFQQSVEFDDKGYSAISLIAKIPFTTIQVAFPQMEEGKEFISSVDQLDVVDFESEVLARTQNKIDVEFDYDASVTVSLKDIFNRYADLETVDSQADWGIGIGVIGVKVTNQVKHDLRFRTDTTPYRELQNSVLIERTLENDFLATYFTAYYDFSITDEIILGISGKRYFDADKTQGKLSVNGFVIGLNLQYFPNLEGFMEF
jgi:hypothetical protein